MKILITFLACFLFVTRVSAETLVVESRFDRWNYPFNTTPGDRLIGTTFGAIGNPSFDDRDAQILLGFDVTNSGTTDSSNYTVQSATIVLTVATDGAFEYDPSYDSFRSYLEPSMDADVGRPIELYGVGFRNGYTRATLGDDVSGPPVFGETEAFGVPGPPGPEKRSAYAADFDGTTQRDVSNDVRNAQESSPWAVARTNSVAPGGDVPQGAEMRFDIDLADQSVLNYLRNGLADGELFFSVVSMHEATQGSPQGIPAFFLANRQQVTLGNRPRLELRYTVVPEPSPIVIGLGVLVSLCGTWRRRAT